MGHNAVLGGGGFHHAAIKARDWERSIAFYHDILGFQATLTWSIGDDRRAGMFDTGDGNYLEIFEDPDFDPSPNGAILHLALRTADVDAATARVRDAGMTITVEPKDVTIQATNDIAPVPVRLAFFVGPNGETWELFQNERT